MPNAEHAAPVCLDAFGDLLTDRDLERLIGASEHYARNARHYAKRRGVAPALPATVPGLRFVRYRKVDVAEWLATGRGSARRRIA